MEANPIFQIQAELFKAETMRNKSVKLVFISQENIAPEPMKRIFEWRDQTGFLLFAIRQIQPEDVLAIPEVKTVEPGDKSPSQRMRAVLYRAWEKDKHGYNDFNLYYQYRMERFINKIKDELA